MVFRNRLLALIAGVVLLASPQFGFAETTTIKVPQGTGVFPTIGQVKCLEELGSGRFCAATYECADDSGELWGDLANHNGRRAIGATAPVANQRDCVITVDGKASVRWLTGYRPAGREGELVGLTTSADALRPVVRTTGTDDGGGNLLHYILERHDTSLAEITEFHGCDQYRVGNAEHDQCVQRFFNDGSHAGATPHWTLTVPDNARTRCLAPLYERYCKWHWDYGRHLGINNGSGTYRCENNVGKAHYLLGARPPRGNNWSPYSPEYGLTAALEYHKTGDRDDVSFGRYNEEADFPCRELAEQELSRMGIGVRYCGDNCQYPNEYDLTIME